MASLADRAGTVGEDSVPGTEAAERAPKIGRCISAIFKLHGGLSCVTVLFVVGILTDPVFRPLMSDAPVLELWVIALLSLGPAKSTH